MKVHDWGELLLLAAIWGASFLLMRLAAPAFGPFALVEVRVALAGLLLLPLVVLRRAAPGKSWGAGSLRARLAVLALVGLFNSALPFVLFSYASLSLAAGYSALLNATTPLWTAVIGRVVLREPVRPLQWCGLLLGAAGVAVLVWGKLDLRPGASGWAILACLAAPASYGIGAHLIRRRAAWVPPLALTSGSQLAAAVLVAPFAAATWPAIQPGPTQWAVAITLAVACTGFAYLLYFRLIGRLGATKAASVTFLIPLFAALWGGALLDEQIGPRMLVGGAIVLAGTALTLGRARAAAKPPAEGSGLASSHRM
jgi:drug/metabolite transporter (DMT)-like permease